MSNNLVTVRRAALLCFVVNGVAILYMLSVLLAPLYYSFRDQSSKLGHYSGWTRAGTSSAEAQVDLSALEAQLSSDVIKQGGSSSTATATTATAAARAALASGAGTLEGPVPKPQCHTELRADYDGRAVAWGITHLKDSAAECCQACMDHAARAKPGEPPCNTWVYCPKHAGCWSPDIYDHKYKECWLKQADVLKINYRGAYPEAFRAEHKTAPEYVDWVAGRTS